MAKVKKCSECKTDKPDVEFRKIGKNKLRANCRCCEKRYSSCWRKDNPDKVKKYKRDRYKNEPAYRVWSAVCSGLRRVIKTGSKTKTMKKYLGCSAKELKLHIEKQFKEGMSWENYGLYGWHIDHIIPVSTIRDENNIEQIKKVCHYTNL